MLILVAGPKGWMGKSTCAVNLACELADLASTSTDRWQGEHSVVLVDADAEGTASRCCSGGHLPVSGERLRPEDLKDIERWRERMLAVVMEVDYVVVDGPSELGAVMKAIVNISDLVVIPCSVDAADLMTIVPLLELVKSTRAARSDGGPKCLLVPTHVNAAISSEAIEIALRRFGEPVGPAIQQRAEFTNAFNAGRWIGDFAPTSAAHSDIKALAASVDRLLTNVEVAVTEPAVPSIGASGRVG
jgi:cellulose biosynthesis protein BcsQ